MKELKKFIKRLKARIAEAEDYVKTHPFNDERKDAQNKVAVLKEVLAEAEEIAGGDQPLPDAGA